MGALRNILWLGMKELRSLRRDVFLLAFVVYAFTFAIYSMGSGITYEVHDASVAFVDEDRSQLSGRIRTALLRPQFQPARDIAPKDVDAAMDSGRFTFVIDVPPHFESDVIAGRNPSLQVNVDATAVMQAFVGALYIQNIAADELARFASRGGAGPASPVRLETHYAFNPNLTTSWFTSIMGIVQFVSMLGIMLSGAALIREREHGTIDHLLTMPVTPIEIMLAKMWSNGLVVALAAALSLVLVVRGALAVPTAGSSALFLAGTVIYLFFATSLGIFLGTVARTMPQLGLLTMLVVIPINMLSGGQTPIESQPEWLQQLTILLASRHYVTFAQAILHRGAGLDTVWPQFAAVAALALPFFLFSLAQFRRALARSQ